MGNQVTIEAPMPGVVLRYEVKEGASVNEGDVLLVMEAMKMENEINSPSSGIVKEIKFKSGDRIEEGDVLMTIE
jgi:pyruvate carboxylase subunit B